MDRIVILGAAAAIPTLELDNTHFVIEAGERAILVDCASSPFARLTKAEINLTWLNDLILTHFHPDHVYGLPLLLMELWLRKRKNALTIHGLTQTLEKAKEMMSAFDWEKWPDMYPVTFHPVDGKSSRDILVDDHVSIQAFQVVHLVPTIGLRINFRTKHKIVAYSCDGERASGLLELASNADILIQEAAGKAAGHTSAFEAGEVAEQARVKSLYLIHYPANSDPNVLLGEAQKKYHGPITLARDFLEIRI